MFYGDVSAMLGKYASGISEKVLCWNTCIKLVHARHQVRCVCPCTWTRLLTISMVHTYICATCRVIKFTCSEQCSCARYSRYSDTNTYSLQWLKTVSIYSKIKTTNTSQMLSKCYNNSSLDMQLISHLHCLHVRDIYYKEDLGLY